MQADDGDDVLFESHFHWRTMPVRLVVAILTSGGVISASGVIGVAVSAEDRPWIATFVWCPIGIVGCIILCAGLWNAWRWFSRSVDDVVIARSGIRCGEQAWLWQDIVAIRMLLRDEPPHIIVSPKTGHLLPGGLRFLVRERASAWTQHATVARIRHFVEVAGLSVSID